MNNTIKKYGALIMLGLSAAVLFAAACTSVYAWLTGNRAAKNEGMDIQIEGICDVTIEDCYAYRFDDTDMAVVVTQITEETGSVMVSEYDNVFKERNQYTPLILRLTLSGFSEESDGALKITVPFTEENYKDSSNKVINALSNVAFVRCGFGLTSAKNADTYSGNELDEKDAIYYGAKEALTASLCDASAYFLENGAKVEAPVTLSIPYSAYSGYIYKEDEVSKLILNFEFDYDSELVSAYSDSYGTALAPSEFTADIGLITIE